MYLQSFVKIVSSYFTLVFTHNRRNNSDHPKLSLRDLMIRLIVALIALLPFILGYTLSLLLITANDSITEGL